MGNRHSTVKNTCMDEINNINEDDLDISNIDKLQIKAIKEMRERIVKLEKENQTNMLYAIPKVDFCNMSLFQFNNFIIKLSYNLRLINMYSLL